MNALPLRAVGAREYPPVLGVRSISALPGEAAHFMSRRRKIEYAQDPRADLGILERSYLSGMFPTCESYGSPTNLRENAIDGSLFAGCSRFPNCRYRSLRVPIRMLRAARQANRLLKSDPERYVIDGVARPRSNVSGV